ncbi:MAG TPA: Omp28-related outer membrane protein [Ignavibacteria bacterium]|jgi:hypothetical protein
MKKRLLVVIALFALLGILPNNASAQTGFNTIVEYCTGTWCQWCPCGHEIINDILVNYPNTMVLGYHGPSNDPWTSYGLPMIQLFGFNAYPTGVVGRRTGIISRSGWNNQVVIQSNQVQPGCSIAFSNYNYNSGTRTVTADVVCTALQNLTGSYYLNLMITEDNLVYPQTGNSSCTGGSNYVHHHVVKGQINGTTGQLVSSSWNQNQSVTIPLNYVIPSGFVETNCKINAFVYLQGSSISTDSYIQQTKIIPATGVTGIINQNETPNVYNLEQNYPNPFNPTTNIKFTIPKDGNVTLKIYDMLGNEVETYLNEFVKAGVYKAEFDGSNLASGIYFYTLRASDFVDTKKMTLVK